MTSYQKLRGCQKESTIVDDSVIHQTSPTRDLLDADVIDSLKQKVIKEYLHFFTRLERGYQDEYSLIMDEINYLDLYPLLDNQRLLMEYYLNKDYI